MKLLSRVLVASEQGRLAEVEGDCECYKVTLKQKDKDLQEYRNVCMISLIYFVTHFCTELRT
jgi:hypothetical protein